VDEQRIDGFPAGRFKGFYGSKLQSHLGEIKWRDWFATFQGRDLWFLSLMPEKYDKSLEETMLEAQLKIMHFFDIPKWIVGTWRSMVCSSRCSNGRLPVCRLSAANWGCFHLGRKHDCFNNTFGGTLSHREELMCLIGGDDNVTCFPVDIVLEDKSREAAEKYNMEIKTILMIRCISVPASSFY
jgi:hypothetical protein